MLNTDFMTGSHLGVTGRHSRATANGERVTKWLRKAKISKI